MELFRRRKEPPPKLIPVSMAAVMIELFGLPPDAIFLNDTPEWMTEEEFAALPRPSVEELMQDPDVAAVLEAVGPHGEYLDLPES